MRLSFSLTFLLCTIAYLPAFSQDYTLDKKDTSEFRFINKKKFYIYKVEKGETIYSITKKFSVSEKELQEFNPDLKDGLKTKMKLWVPASLSVQAVAAEEKTEKKSKDSPLQIALFLPFRIDNNTVTKELLTDSIVLSENLEKEANASLEFYEGCMYAMEALAKSDKIKFHLRVVDTKDDTVSLAQTLKNPELSKMDFIIVSGSAAGIRMLNSFSREHGIPLWVFAMNTADLLKDNPNAVSMLPSSLIQCMEAGKKAARIFKGAGCILLNSTNIKEAERTKAFKSGWLEEDKKAFIREISKPDTISLRDSLYLTYENVVFVPSSNEDFVSAFLNALQIASPDRKVNVIGIPTWQFFESIDPGLLEKLNTYLFSTSSIDYENGNTATFRKYFRDTYNIEASEHAYQGYDAMHVLGEAWLKHGNDFSEKFYKDTYTGLFTNYHFNSTSGVLENDFIYVLRYKEYNLVRVEDQ